MNRLLIFLILLWNADLSAQQTILLEQDSAIQIHQNVDISNEFQEFAVDLFFKNNTNDTILVNWKRSFGPNCPLGWDVVSADQFLTYVPSIHESQTPILMTPTDSHFILRQLFYPRQLAGCCNVHVVFSLDDAPNTPIDSGYYYIEINADDCGVSAVAYENRDQIQMYPNPTSTTLFMENSFLIQSIEVLDFTGNTVLHIKDRHIDEIDFFSFPTGIYFVKITDVYERQTIRKVVKQSP